MVSRWVSRGADRFSGYNLLVSDDPSVLFSVDLLFLSFVGFFHAFRPIFRGLFIFP